MTTQTAAAHSVRLYLSGPIDVAKQIIRAECLREGLCVTIEPTTFLYTGGEETGYVVGLLNYPRFPTTSGALTDRARNLMLMLLGGTHQHSALMVAGNVTEWVTLREEAPDKPIGTADADGPVPHQQTLTNSSLVSHHREDEPR